MNLRLRKRISAAILAVFAIISTIPSTPAQVRPLYDLGAGGLGQKLRRLQTTASVMHTGAHPDDEDSALLAKLARGDNARVSYLSLTRGEGGQNVIGPELFESLGMIRTEELLQARRLDGGEQFFTRFMEYGFSKKLSEAATIWGEKEVLGDMVRAIRLFRPLIVISRFSGTPADGHGHHQLTGYLTPLAFRAAGDPSAFPEHFSEGLEPWKPMKLYVGQGFGGSSQTPPTITVPTGDYDSVIGRSYFEIAMEGRSQHKSQEMGMLELRGAQQSGLRLLESTDGFTGNEKTIYDRLDVSIKGIARLTENTENPLADKLAQIQTVAEKALAEYDPFNPQKLLPTLAEGLKLCQAAEGSTRNPKTKFMLRLKARDFADALQAAGGIVVDALSDTETVVAGDSLGVSVRVFAPASTEFKLDKVTIKSQAGWKTEATDAPKPEAGNIFRPRTENSREAAFFRVTTSADAPPTQPYWLMRPREKFRFDWTEAADAKNLPFASELATAEVTMTVAGQQLTIMQPVEYRFADDIRGELRRRLNVVPHVTHTLESSLMIVPRSSAAQQQRVVLSITNNAPRETKGAISLDLPAGWTATPKTRDFALKGRGEKTAATFDVSIPAGVATGAYKIGARSTVEGRDFDRTMFEVAYPHIQTHRRYAKSEVDVKVVDLRVAKVNVGYIMGTGDRVPEAIRLLGLPVTMLSEKDLSTGDLSRFDVIVVGIRASQVRRDFVANNGRLLDYVRNGGTMIVQYQQHEYVRENMLPFPAKLDAVINGNQRLSNLRTVDENAPVKILVPDHPVFTSPNRISSADFENWVQERHLYSLSSLDPQYVPLLESHDEGEPEINGGMVYAKLGKGHFVYNSYSFFRQLPTGNPGAYRIFANLLSLPKNASRKP